MKTSIRLLSLLLAGSVTSSFAAEFTASSIQPDTVINVDATTLAELLTRTRARLGMSRGALIEQLGTPNLMLHSDVWVFTSFHAGNVFGAEGFDALVVTFKNDKVAAIKLSRENEVRVAAARSGLDAKKLVKR
jgi:hypothetical protein